MRRTGRLAALAAVLLLGPLRPLTRAEVPDILVIPALPRTSLHPWARAALDRALSAAEEKVSRPACREVLRDFRDGAGRLLENVLAEAGWPGEWMLRGLRFTDGTMSSPCTDRRTLAWTHPGDRTVRLCVPQFHEAAYGNAGAAANMLIHEALHGLGLGENPPSSQDITARITERCGR